MTRIVAEGVTKLGSAAHNFYLMVEGGKAVVVDAGCSRELPSLVRALAVHGMDLTDVEAMLITHAHADHIGSAADAEAAGVDVRVHVDDLDRATGTYQGRAAVGPTDLPLWRPTIIGFLARLVRAGVMSQPPVLHPTTFEDGDVLDLPGRPVVVHTPGHTEGHCAFHLPDRGVLFTGDAVVTDGFQGTRGPQMLADPFHHDPAKAVRSLDRLRGLDADVVLPGHGHVFPGSPAELVDAVRQTLV